MNSEKANCQQFMFVTVTMVSHFTQAVSSHSSCVECSQNAYAPPYGSAAAEHNNAHCHYAHERLVCVTQTQDNSKITATLL